MPNAQEYINENYPQEERKNVTELLINDKNLEGKLDVNDFINLEKLDCSHNKLTGLSISKNLKLQVINVRENQIVANLNNFFHLRELEKLDLSSSTNSRLQEKRDDLFQQRGRGGKRELHY
jgi:Leucine-rich repeat (LRR) protein